MSVKLYLNLLVLFGVSCQGIISALSEKEIYESSSESSDLLVRQKRVINRLPGRDVRQSIRTYPYVVAIKQYRIEEHCVGVILSYHTVLTAAVCVEQNVANYRVYSGCAQLSRVGHATTHNITSKREKVGSHPFRANDGIALITVYPPFIYAVNTQNIKFYEEPVHPGLLVSVAGWGCNPSGDCGTEHSEWLRSITVPVISNEDCNLLYLQHFMVTDRDICTLDAFEKQYCGVNDAGAPLVAHERSGHKLVGIHLWNGGIIGRPNPDVFVNLQHPDYKTWIPENIHRLEMNLNNPVMHFPYHMGLHN